MSETRIAPGLAACLAATLICLPPAAAQSIYPSHPIHVVVPYSAGGVVETVARAVTEQVGRDLKQTIIIEARPGADSNVGTAAAAHGAPDGYTWLVTGPAILVNPALYKDAGWNALQDFTCVGIASWNRTIAVVPPSLQVKTLAAFVALARARPGELSFGNPGTGSSIDLTARKFFQAANITLANAGYKGQPPALRDLVKSLVHFEIVSLSLALPAIRDGTVMPLAVFADKRLAELPNVPTIAEAGYPEASYTAWYGIYVRSATPAPVIASIHEAINKALENTAVQRRLADVDIPGRPITLGELSALMRADHEKLTALVQTSGLNR